MFATATLTAHRGATLVTRDELSQYEPPEPKGRWRSVKHALIVDLMHEELARRDIQGAKEEYAIQREGNYLFAALTTNWLDTRESAAAIAFRHSNDKSEAMKMYAGVHVFIYDNIALSGDEIILNRKHTTRLNVAAELTKAFDRYKDGALVLQRNIQEVASDTADVLIKLLDMDSIEEGAPPDEWRPPDVVISDPQDFAAYASCEPQQTGGTRHEADPQVYQPRVQS